MNVCYFILCFFISLLDLFSFFSSLLNRIMHLFGDQCRTVASHRDPFHRVHFQHRGRQTGEEKFKSVLTANDCYSTSKSSTSAASRKRQQLLFAFFFPPPDYARVMEVSYLRTYARAASTITQRSHLLSFLVDAIMPDSVPKHICRRTSLACTKPITERKLVYSPNFAFASNAELSPQSLYVKLVLSHIHIIK